MRKKIFISILLLSAFCFLFKTKVFAQTYLLETIEVNFCNYQQTNRELDIITKAGKPKDICVEITNKGSQEIILNLEFFDSAITSDSFKGRACNSPNSPKKKFGNFFLPYTKEVFISPQSTIQKTYTIKYPIGFRGLSHGCLAYYIVGSDIPDSNIISIRIRSIKFVDIFVTGTKPKQVITLSQSPILSKIDDEYIISFGIKNKGNIPEKLYIVSTLSNIFGYQKEFIFETNIEPNTGKIITTKSFIIPFYGGPYRFHSKISYIPEFNFNITDGIHPSDLYAGGTKNIQNLFFIRTRQSRLTLGFIGFIIYIILRRKLKNK